MALVDVKGSLTGPAWAKHGWCRRAKKRLPRGQWGQLTAMLSVDLVFWVKFSIIAPPCRHEDGSQGQRREDGLRRRRTCTGTIVP